MARFNSGGVGAALGGTPAPASPAPPADSDTDPNTFSRPQGPLAWGMFVFVVLGLLLIYWLVHDEVHILNVAVAPEERRKGVARMLMGETEKRAHQASAALMTLEVRRSNQAALDLYREFDYRAVGVRPNYYVDEGEDAIVMIKELKRAR